MRDQQVRGLRGSAARGGAQRIVRSAPFNAEAPVENLKTACTPAGTHFVRSSFEMPTLDPDVHRLLLGGAVARPLSLARADLEARPQRTLLVTLECAGNGRVELTPLPPGEPWRRGAVSTAAWTGVPLASLLHEAGLRDDVTTLVAVGADHGIPSEAVGAVPFARALPIDKALHPDTLVALEMNGAPLVREHGAPFRLIVPGWYGMASVKWLVRLEAWTRPFDGYFQGARYVWGDGTPVSTVRVKSLLVHPGEGAQVARGRVRAWGWAWSGAGAVTRVALSLDGGGFVEATLAAALGRWAWRRFALDLEIGALGRHTLRVRAVDASGAQQPDRAPWNPLGYGNNGATVTVFDVV